MQLPDEAQRLLSEKRCLNCEKKFKTGERVIRGCHVSCHRQILRAIERKQLTEEQALSEGLLTPPKKGGRKPEAKNRLAAILEKLGDAGDIASELEDGRDRHAETDSVVSEHEGSLDKNERKSRSSPAKKSG